MIFRMIGRRARRASGRIFRGTFWKDCRSQRNFRKWTGSEQKTIWWWEQGSERKWKHWKGSWVLEHVKGIVEWVWKKWNFQVDIGREPSRLHLCQHCVEHRWSCQRCAFCVKEWQSEYTVMEWVWDGSGSGRSAGKRAEADRKQKGLGFNSCVAPSCTQCPISES